VKVKANAGTLSKLLQIVLRAIPNRTQLKLLTAVLLEAEPGPEGRGVLRLSATDTEISITLGARAPVDEGGRAAIPARLLAEIVRSLPEGEILIEADAAKATVSRGKSAYELRFYDPKDFPKPPALPAVNPEREAEDATGARFSVPSNQLAAAIASVAPCISKDEQRPVLTGVYFSFADGGATMVATDGYRMALNEAKLAGAKGAAGEAIIPGRVLREVARLSELSESVEVALTENAAIFAMRGVVVSTRLIDGNYPVYGRLLPDSCAQEFAVQTKTLADALKRVNLIAGHQSPPVPVRLAFSHPGEAGTFGGGELTISVAGAETGRATETIGAEVPEGQSFEICFNPSYLLDGVAAVGTERVRFLVNEPLRPVLLGGPDVPATKPPSRLDEGDEASGGHARVDDGGGAGAAGAAPDAPFELGSSVPEQNGGKSAGRLLYMLMPMRGPKAASQDGA
jgi:DNA polymerase III subunit beta